jgi:hypothetical protein
MNASDKKKEALYTLLNEAAAEVKKNPQTLPEHIYKTVEALSTVFYLWRNSDGEKGWSRAMTDADGKPFFTEEESSAVENGFAALGPVLQEKQLGGAVPLIPRGEIATRLKNLIDPRELSIDNAYYTLQRKIGEYDTQWKEIADSLGIVKGVEAGPDIKGMTPAIPPLAIPPLPYLIVRKTILPFVSYAIELLRLWLSLQPVDSQLFRFFTSFIQGFLDAIRGDAKQAILSLLGLYSKSGLMVSVAGRFIINVAELVSPDLREQFSDISYKSAKSLIVGFVLWTFSTFAPEALRAVVDQGFQKIRNLVNDVNTKITAVETQMSAAGGKAGVKVTMPRIPQEFVPSMDDIQNLQMLSRMPEVTCSPEFREIIEPMMAIPPLRLILDLMNIPTVKEDIDKTCTNINKDGLAESISKAAEPKVEIIPGGPADQAAQAVAKVEEVKDLAEKAKEDPAQAAKLLAESTPEGKEALAAASKGANAIKGLADAPAPAKGGRRRTKKTKAKKSKRKTKRRS